MEIFGIDFGCAYGSLVNGQIPEKECLLPLLSKILGYCIVAASTTVKLPQRCCAELKLLSGLTSVLSSTADLMKKVGSLDHRFVAIDGGFAFMFIRLILKILKHGSVRGLSVISFELEVVGYTIALAYCLHKQMPFSAYGELAFLLIQAIILVAVIYYYSQPTGIKAWIRPLLYCAVAPTILAGQIDPVLFEALYASQHAIFFVARIPQIWKNFRSKSTGELSFLTFFMNFAGGLVRVFTSIQEKAPTSVLMGSILGVVLNGTLLSQILVYQTPPAKDMKKTN